ncbi:hypothetical protein [Flavimaricola marinus]|uniref:Lipoprotein n=1 Tax=Flavimaricola marinus TaxID=1819565 RepID=A0A238LJ06_9RHOB|nr:hypothetical protein [Flavimaricola marinus]SMY09697.1 hypothetical protein LOM8899_03869 [Flavimaricola marinus]
MYRVALLTAFLALGACQQAPSDQLIEPESVYTVLDAGPARPLPVLGRITSTYAGQPTVWNTLDFSVGAIDPSANVTTYDGTTLLYVGGYLPDQDNREDFGRLRIEAELPQGAVPGAAGNVVIAVIDTPGYDAPRYVSGPDARLQVTQIAPPVDISEVYGEIFGTFVATLCRAASREAPPDTSDCKPIAGEFSTQGSIQGM